MECVYRQIDQLPHPLDQILSVARGLLENGAAGGNTDEQIAAAFVLERLEYLPQGWGAVEAWERLGVEWQFYVKHLRQEFRHLIEALESGAAGRVGR